MVLLLTDVFLLLTQVLLWLLIALVAWFVLLKALPRAFLGGLVLLLIVVVLVLAFFQGPPSGAGDVLEILWRIISFPFTPLGLALVLLTVLLTRSKISTVLRRTILILLTLLALGSFPFVAYYLAQELEMEAIELVRPLPALNVPGARRVIVLLGQGTTRPFLRPPQDTRPEAPPRVERPIPPETFQILSQIPIQLTERGDSIIYAARLYQEEVAKGSNPVIVVSASSRPDRLQKEGERREDASESRDIQNFLTQTLGIPVANIRLGYEGNSVRRSAEEVLRVLQQQGINGANQLVLVTTAMNMNRAALTFSSVFEEAFVYARPTDFRTLPPATRLSRLLRGRDLVERQFQATDFLPSAEAFALTTEAFEEYINAFYYFLRGWIKPFRLPPMPQNPVTTQPLLPRSSAPNSPSTDFSTSATPTSTSSPTPTFTSSPTPTSTNFSSPTSTPTFTTSPTPNPTTGEANPTSPATPSGSRSKPPRALW